MRNPKFQYMPKLIFSLFKEVGYGDLYKKIWNPLNYAIVGGIGVLINYLMWMLLAPLFPWWITNGLAILTAWLWNWSMSVGPLGWVWGFQKRGSK